MFFSSAKEPAAVDNRASNHSAASLAKDDSFDDIDDADDDDFVIIGTCRALYSFDGKLHQPNIFIIYIFSC